MGGGGGGTRREYKKASACSVFAVVASPSTEETVNGRFWCIEQQAELFPAPISGTAY
jgi:hypothetical protein